MLRGSSNVRATGRTLQEEVAAIGTSLLPQIHQSDSNSFGRSESHTSSFSQSRHGDGPTSDLHHSSQHQTQSATNGSNQQVLSTLFQYGKILRICLVCMLSSSNAAQMPTVNGFACVRPCFWFLVISFVEQVLITRCKLAGSSGLPVVKFRSLNMFWFRMLLALAETCCA